MIRKYLKVILLTGLYDASWVGYSYAVSHHDWMMQAILALTTAVANYSLLYIATEIQDKKQRLLVMMCGGIGNLLGSSALLGILEALGK